MSARTVIGMLIALLALSCTSERTGGGAQLLVIVSSDLSVPDELDRVALDVSGQQIEGVAQADLRERGFPRTVTLVHEGGPLGPVTIRVRGYLAEAEIIQKETIAWFPSEGDGQVEIHLDRSCVGVSCGDGRTCDESVCVTVTDPITGDDAGATDAGPLEEDGGEVPTDAAEPEDAGEGEVDAGPPPADAGPLPVDAADASPAPSDAGYAPGEPDTGPPPPPSPGEPPRCTTSLPVGGDYVQVGIDLTLKGTCTDPETGAVTQGLTWSSDRDGQIGSGGSTKGRLSTPGPHTLRLCAPDPRDAKVKGCDSVAVTATTESLPTAKILGPVAPGKAGEPITLTGEGHGAGVVLRWFDAFQPLSGEGTTFTINEPLPGLHVVTLTVRDRDGRTSTDTTTFQVLL